MDVFLSLGLVFAFIFVIGRLMEKLRVPWIFSALLIGAFLSFYNPISEFTSSQTFEFFSQLGMYFLLFMIGFELDVRRLLKESKFIFKSTFFIILFEAFFGSLVIHYVFAYNWSISVLVALSFATVGEVILIPILDEFNIINTKLGQMIIGIGTFDDAIEIFVLIFAVVLIGSSIGTKMNLWLVLSSLLFLFVLTYGFTLFKKEGRKFRFLKIPTLLFFSIIVLLIFIGVGEFAEASPLGALLAGISLRTFLPRERSKLIEESIKAISYGIFAPFFFLDVGLQMNLSYILYSPLLVLLVVLVSKGSKLIASCITGMKTLGLKQSILLGIGLSVRFSMSLIIIKMLLNSGLIDVGLYSVIIASSIIFKFIVPLLFANLLVKWNIAKPKHL